MYPLRDKYRGKNSGLSRSFRDRWRVCILRVYVGLSVLIEFPIPVTLISMVVLVYMYSVVASRSFLKDETLRCLSVSGLLA